MKLVSFYLPQFHEIIENNNAWGKGFTEWVNVRKAEQLFWGHYQPRIPLYENYYNLLDDGVMEWQISLAKKSGIYGFCFYHYWFEGHMVLEKPVENLRQNKNIDFHYCFAWANESWTKTWHGAGGEKEILIAQTYGAEEEWEKHYCYFRDYFLDKRYIKIENKPVLLLYRVRNITRFNDMIKYWNERSKLDGLDGIFVISMNNCREHVDRSIWINGTVDFEPNRTKSEKSGEKIIDIQPVKRKTIFRNRLAMRIISYNKINNQMLKKSHDLNHFRTVFVDYDDSPRRGERATIMRGSSPSKFGRYLRKMMEKSVEEGNDFLFINAWNEWGEGNYLEPDTKNKYKYLIQVKKSMKKISKKENKI